MNNEPREQLRIAMICDPIGSNNSGSVFSTLRFGKLLKARGQHVIFIAAKTKENKDESHGHGIKAYRYRGISLPKAGGWRLALPTVHELKKVFKEEEINVVHIVLPMSGAIVAIRAARALGIRIVAHSHSQPENLFMDMPKFIQPTLNRAWNRYLSWVYSKSEVLIYPSEMARTLLHKLNEKNHPSVVISNGINLAEYKPMSTGSFNQRFNIPNGKIKLLFVGRLFPEKSIDTLIKAVPYILKENNSVHVMIAGAGHLRDQLEKLTHTLKINKHVTFLGLVSEEDKILAYNSCDIFVLPSLAELEGMVVLEAMACGKPIIIADAKMSASRYFVNGNGFLFKKENPQELATQALKLINDEKLRNEMGQVSLENIKKYDIHKSEQLLEDVYYMALDSKKE
jgi:1,2-diacylglycerol 3-alpha-glucosyltransferase